VRNKISFAVDNAEVIDSNKDSNFAVLSLDFFASGPNLHDMIVSERTLLRTADTIKNCPLVWKYDERLDDVYTHDPDEVPCGFVPETSNVTSRVLEDGRTMLSVIAYVWKRYTGELLNFFKRDGGKKPVSVEMIVYDTRELPNNKTEILDFRYEGITILGSFVTPAIPNAEAKVLSFSELKQEYMNDLEKEFPAKYIEMGSGAFVESPHESTKETVSMNKEISEKTFGQDMPEKEEKPMNKKEAAEVKMAETEEVADELIQQEQTVTEELMAEEDGGEKDEENKKDGKENKEEAGKDFEGLDTERSANSDEEFAAKIKELSGQIEKMSAEIDAYKTENEELKKFKQNIEESQKAFAVEQTIRELEEKVIIPEDKKSEMIAEAENYSYSDIEAWKTACKAKSFDFVARESKDSSTVKRAGLPFGNVTAKSKKDLWQ